MQTSVNHGFTQNWCTKQAQQLNSKCSGPQMFAAHPQSLQISAIFANWLLDGPYILLNVFILTSTVAGCGDQVNPKCVRVSCEVLIEARGFPSAFSSVDIVDVRLQVWVKRSWRESAAIASACCHFCLGHICLRRAVIGDSRPPLWTNLSLVFAFISHSNTLIFSHLDHCHFYTYIKPKIQQQSCSLDKRPCTAISADWTWSLRCILVAIFSD